MNELESYQLEAMSVAEMEAVYGGWTGSAELARDVGRVLGAAAGVLIKIGEVFYTTGGLFGNNRRLMGRAC
jgi:hypothetical protein